MHSWNPGTVIAEISQQLKREKYSSPEEASALLYVLRSQLPNSFNTTPRQTALAQQYHQAILELLAAQDSSSVARSEIIRAGGFRGLVELKSGSVEAIWLRTMINLMLNCSDPAATSAAAESLSAFMASSRTMVPAEKTVQHYYPEIIAVLNAREEMDHHAGKPSPVTGVIGNLKLMGIYDPPTKPGSNLSSPTYHVQLKDIPAMGSSPLETKLNASVEVKSAREL